MTIVNGQKCRVTLEYEDGRIFSGMAMAIDMVVESGIQRCYTAIDDTPLVAHRGCPVWELTLRGIEGLPTIEMLHDEYHEQIIKPSHIASEWKCDYCGAVWPRAENQCRACGAYRSFIYE
jgi:hypothetical protein